MKGWSILLAVALTLGACGKKVADDIASKPDTVGGLSCSFSISPPALPYPELVPVKMILTNKSSEPIRVCTFCMAWRSGSNGKCSVSMTPNAWKSDRPTDEQLAKHIETIAPGASAGIPFEIERGPTIEITGNYWVDEAFAKKLNIWGGSVQARKFTGHLP